MQGLGRGPEPPGSRVRPQDLVPIVCFFYIYIYVCMYTCLFSQGRTWIMFHFSTGPEAVSPSLPKASCARVGACEAGAEMGDPLPPFLHQFGDRTFVQAVIVASCGASCGSAWAWGLERRFFCLGCVSKDPPWWGRGRGSLNPPAPRECPVLPRGTLGTGSTLWKPSLLARLGRLWDFGEGGRRKGARGSFQSVYLLFFFFTFFPLPLLVGLVFHAVLET